MNVSKIMKVTTLGALLSAAPAKSAETNDPYLWLEDVTGERAIEWVKAQNKESTAELQARSEFEPVRQKLLQILNSKDKIPFVSKHGKWYYNFWQDETHVRGLWRRTTLESYRKAQPEWETVIDLDKLAASENENWVWKGADILEPTYDRCMLSLSRGGADAVVIREFDLEQLRFVPGGFIVPEAKTDTAWRNRNTLYIASDFGTNTLTTSGYPRVVKEWERGSALSDARQVFEGQASDVRVGASVTHDHGRVYEFISRIPTFYSSEMLLRRGNEWVPIAKPADAEISMHKDQVLIQLRSEWVVGTNKFPAGSLVACPLESLLAGKTNAVALFTPTERTSLDSISDTKSYLVLNVLDNVQNKLTTLQLQPGGTWSRGILETPPNLSVRISGVDDEESDDYFMVLSGYLTPTSLHWGTVGGNNREQLKSLPGFFNTEGLEVTQHSAKSKDGTAVPYFMVARKGLKLDGSNPTLLYGYGGFEIALLPSYNAGMGASWLERGGVYVLANIRGGGEFGPRWHQAALKANRQRAYDDFAAVAEHLLERKVTSKEHLGIQGGSNGGLLMGVMLTQRPDLFGAVVCQVPLLDMQRFNQLLAGASWMAEYGNPDVPEEWEFIRRYSPYQNVSKDKKYPRTLFTTSTRDDRVHPGHARKMVARMKEQGHDVLYYENIEGGHGGAANNKQAAFMSALAYTFLWNELR